MSIGEIAYNAYCEEVGWRSVKGEQLPAFEEQSDKLKTAWGQAALAVYAYAVNKIKSGG